MHPHLRNSKIKVIFVMYLRVSNLSSLLIIPVSYPLGNVDRQTAFNLSALRQIVVKEMRSEEEVGYSAVFYLQPKE